VVRIMVEGLQINRCAPLPGRGLLVLPDLFLSWERSRDDKRSGSIGVPRGTMASC
jgi:hypothetical protein